MRTTVFLRRERQIDDPSQTSVRRELDHFVQVMTQVDRMHPTRMLSSIGLAMTATTFALLISCLTPAGAQTIAGSVTSLTGSATLKRAGGAMNVTVGMPVQVADEIAVPAGGKVTITLSDGSLLDAGPSSSIVIDQQMLGAGGGRASTRVNLLSGLLRSVVKHSSKGNPPNFEVHTPNAILAARSTEFYTAYAQGRRRPGYGGCDRFTDLQTHAGSVGVRSAAKPDAPEISVDAGYESTVACDSVPSSPGPVGLTGIPWGTADALTIAEPPPGSTPPAQVGLPPFGVPKQ